MFGYIAPLKSELKVKELALYNAYYCGVCRAIGARAGEAARLALSYDCAFVAILLDSLCEHAPCEPRRCPYKPLSKPKPTAPESGAVRFAADVNVVLTWYKLDDDGRDEARLDRRLLSGSGRAALRPALKRVSSSRPGLEDAIARGIERLCELERSRCGEPDAPCAEFAHALSDAVALYPGLDGKSAPVIRAMTYALGKWVYLVDAWDDREKDAAHNAYNVFNIAEVDRERAGFLINCSLNEAILAYELLEPVSNRGILDNIMYEGCAARTKALLGGSL